jgi:hypothetical protein
LVCSRDYSTDYSELNYLGYLGVNWINLNLKLSELDEIITQGASIDTKEFKE